MRSVQASRVTRLGAISTLLLALASCQSSNIGAGLGGKEPLGKPGDENLTGADLRAYCPRIELREGTAIMKTYTKGHKDEPDEIVYLATIADVTRTCSYQGGMLYMEVVAAGRVVTGPKGTAGTVDLPLRVAVTHGADVPYSKLGKLQVSVAPNAGATQFIYKDTQVAVPAPTAQDLQIYVGFDEGPYNTP